MDEELIYWIWLQQCLGFGARGVTDVLAQPGHARFMYESTSTELRLLGMFAGKTLARLADKRLSDAEKTLARCEKLGYSVISPDDPRYPDRLRNIFDPPAVLYVSGILPAIDSEVCVGIVGTRSASRFGTAAAQELARHLTEAGAVVISGGAVGIDTAAHQGALMAKNGRTVAVLGCGIDYPYNTRGKPLRDCISQNGAVVSEYPPGSEPISYHFPIRNRLISGMSLGVAVIEAGCRSGSLITANLASEQGRDVFAVPGYVGDSRSQGVNQLLREGARELVSPADVLREYAPMFPHKISLDGHERPLMEGHPLLSAGKPVLTDNAPAAASAPKKSAAERSSPKESAPEKSPGENKPEDGQTAAPTAKTTSSGDISELTKNISEDARTVYERLRSGPQNVDELSAASGISPENVLRALTELEIYALARALPGHIYSL